MANFKIEYDQTMGHEGGYVNDPDDAGAETYKGISRRFHPGWPGWVIVDRLKSMSNFPECLKDEPSLEPLVETFYKQEFWDKFQGDQIKDQSVASELFDTSVNMSKSRAVKFLQISLNRLNRNQKLFPDMVEDGQLGPGTLNSLSIYLTNDDAFLLVKMMNVLQGMHYIDYMGKSPKQEKYCRGWFGRVSISKG